VCEVAGGATYLRVGEGVAGPREKWNIGNAMSKGVDECFKAVLADPQCSTYFTYVHDGDGNCGCKADSGTLAIRADSTAVYYAIQSASTAAAPLLVPGSVVPSAETAPESDSGAPSAIRANYGSNCGAPFDASAAVAEFCRAHWDPASRECNFPVCSCDDTAANVDSCRSFTSPPILIDFPILMYVPAGACLLGPTAFSATVLHGIPFAGPPTTTSAFLRTACSSARATAGCKRTTSGRK
jgi:hypothetical protein